MSTPHPVENSKENSKAEFRTLKITMGKDKYKVIEAALKQIQEEYNVSKSRALELLAAEYLS